MLGVVVPDGTTISICPANTAASALPHNAIMNACTQAAAAVTRSSHTTWCMLKLIVGRKMAQCTSLSSSNCVSLTDGKK